MLNRAIFLALISVVWMSSCKNRKNRNLHKPGSVKIESDSYYKKHSVEDILSPTIKPWTYFSSKIKVEYQSADNKKMHPIVNIRMYKDSLIWVSGGLFGIEGFRMVINNDSMVMMNKLEHTYAIYKNNLFKGMSDIPLSVTEIQNLILGNPIFALKFYTLFAQAENSISIQNLQSKFTTQHTFQKALLVLENTTIQDTISNNSLHVTYSDYSLINNHNFPIKSEISATSGDNTAKIILEYNNTDFETAQSFPFSIPSSYAKSK
jgi:hypothetical protein